MASVPPPTRAAQRRAASYVVPNRIVRRRAAIYMRVSSKGQEEKYSLSTQDEACRAYCAERGYEVVEAHVYREVHCGDELWERPLLDQLRAAVPRGEFDVIVSYVYDRF